MRYDIGMTVLQQQALDLSDPLLRVEDLAVAFSTPIGNAFAVDGVSFFVDRGETLCLVGESGCGKSVTALSLLRLIPDPPGRIVNGSIRFSGHDLVTLSEKSMEAIRGNQISMVFQEPMTALNPVFRVGEQVAEILLTHKRLSRKQALKYTEALFGEVGIPNPRERLRDFPHQLSGGMRQRVLIAMAVACEPALIIADEPTTALDMTIQNQVLTLLTALTKDKGKALLLITHDLGVVYDTADRVAVMYAGKIVEQAPVSALFSSPSHPYTRGLIQSRPRLDPGERHSRLQAIPGTVPNPLHRPSGCSFRDRCSCVMAKCSEVPPWVERGKEHFSRCWLV